MYFFVKLDNRKAIKVYNFWCIKTAYFSKFPFRLLGREPPAPHRSMKAYIGKKKRLWHLSFFMSLFLFPLFFFFSFLSLSPLFFYGGGPGLPPLDPRLCLWTVPNVRKAVSGNSFSRLSPLMFSCVWNMYGILVTIYNLTKFRFCGGFADSSAQTFNFFFNSLLKKSEWRLNTQDGSDRAMGY